jgi:hypothetical protein
MSLAHLLSSVPGVRIEHEHEPKLLTEIQAYTEERLGREQMVELLRTTRAPSSIGGELVSGESHNQLSFVLPALAEAFPDARVVWLVRDGRAVVASTVARNIYHPSELSLRAPGTEEWARTRPQADAVGDMTPEEWAALDAFGRCCWYWSYTHRMIERDLQGLPLSCYRVRLEDLPGRWPELAEFCGLSATSIEVPHSNASTRAPMSWQHWSKAQRLAFASVCGSVMNEHYPGWESEMSRSPGGSALSWAIRTRAVLRSSAVSWSRPFRSTLGLGRRRAPLRT